MTSTYYVKVISATKIAVYEDAEFTRPASFDFDGFVGVPLVTKIQSSSLGITYDSFFVNPISSVSTGVLLTYTYYAGSIGTFTVPDNVSTITITVVGAGGGSGGNYQNATTLGSATSGTAGRIVLGDLNVQGGQVLTIYPGIGGSRGLQSWNGGTGGAGGVNYLSAYSGNTGITGNGGGGGGGAASVIITNSSVLIVAAGGAGGAGGTGAAGGAGGGVSVIPAGLTSSAGTNGGIAGNFSAYYSASYGPGGAGALSAINAALTGVPDYSSAFASIPTNNGNGRDFIISGTLLSASGGFTCYRTQAQQGAAFYGPGSALNIYAGQTVTGVNTSGNGGSSFWLSGPDTYSDGSDGYVVISIVNSRYTFYLSTEASTTGVTITPGSLGLNYVSGKTDLVYVVNTGVTINAASTATSALIIYGFNSGDTVTIQNFGTIAGVGGTAGRNNQGGYFEEAGNVDGLGEGGDVPSNPYGNSGGYPAINGSSGGAGGPAIGITTQAYYTRFNVYNYNLITGGGGGAGGGGSNNGVGGNGGNGGGAIQVLGSTNYQTAGTYSYTVPAGITSIRVKAIGAGGGGAAGNDGGYVHYGWGGGGGGSGYETSSDVVVTPGETLTVVIGTGGAGGAGGCGPGGNSGSTGGTTELKRGATTLLTVTGGNGGVSNAGPSNAGGSGGTTGGSASADQGVGFGGNGGASSESFGGAGGPGGGCGSGSGSAGSAGSGGGGGGAQNGSCCGHPGGRGGDGFVNIFTLTGQTQVTLYNQTVGAIIGGGGGGGSGWGNREAGSTAGGSTGIDGSITSNGGGNFGSQGVAGSVITGGAVKIYTGVQTVTLS